MLTFTPSELLTPSEIEALFVKLNGYVKAELLPLNEEQLRWKPEAKRWSIAECAGHLVTAHTDYLQRLDDRLAQLKPRSKPYSPGPLGRFFYRIIRTQPDGQVRKTYKAPAFLQPTQDAYSRPHLVLGQLIEQLEHLRQLTQQSADKDWNSTPVPTSLHPLVRLRWGCTLRFLAAHNERHLLQAQRVGQAGGFPR
jgi:hypothetical protein